MDRKRIEKEFDEKYMHGFWDSRSKGMAIDFAEHIAKIVRNEAMEEAANVCERVEREKWESKRLGGAKDCYIEIRALKDKE